jgi:hypothetical protein
MYYSSTGSCSMRSCPSCHCYRMSAGHVMPADKHNLSERRRRPGGFNKRHCQRRLLSAHICITPHAVDRDFQARKQESVTLAWAKPRQIQGRDRPPTGVLPSPFPHAIICIQLVYYCCCYRSDTVLPTRKLSSSCRVTRPPVLVHARARALMRVTVSSDRRAGSIRQSNSQSGRGHHVFMLPS